MAAYVGLPMTMAAVGRRQLDATGSDCAEMTREDLLRRLEVYLDDLLVLLSSPRHRFSSLAEKDVPKASGLYVIYQENPMETLYAGKSQKSLRFRIMRNHLAYQGNDNLVRYLMKEIGGASRLEVRTHILKLCSVHWIKVDDPERLFCLEHLAIAVTRPRFNKG